MSEHKDDDDVIWEGARANARGRVISRGDGEGHFLELDLSETAAYLSAGKLVVWVNSPKTARDLHSLLSELNFDWITPETVQ